MLLRRCYRDQLVEPDCLLQLASSAVPCSGVPCSIRDMEKSMLRLFTACDETQVMHKISHKDERVNKIPLMMKFLHVTFGRPAY